MASPPDTETQGSPGGSPSSIPSPPDTARVPEAEGDEEATSGPVARATEVPGGVESPGSGRKPKLVGAGAKVEPVEQQWGEEGEEEGEEGEGQGRGDIGEEEAGEKERASVDESW